MIDGAVQFADETYQNNSMIEDVRELLSQSKCGSSDAGAHGEICAFNCLMAALVAFEAVGRFLVSEFVVLSEADFCRPGLLPEAL